MGRIFIDGLGLVDGHFSGVGQYILGILRGLDDLITAKQSEGGSTPSITVIIPRDCVEKFNKFNFKHINYKTLPLPFRYVAALWHRGLMPPIDLWCGRGLYFFPRFVDMPLLFSKNIGTVIYDLSYELHRQYSDEGNAVFLSKQVRTSVKRAMNIITISNNARDEIIKFYGMRPENVHVATPATDPSALYRRSEKEIKGVKEKYGLPPNDYILALSNLEPRKNLQALVDSYCKLPATLRKNRPLLLVGVNGWKSETLFKEIVEKVKEGYDIMRPNSYVSDDDKAAIISGACLLVYPSHYEGFGMPPLEALACGVPVITSDNSSLPEVVGGVGEMVNVSKDNHQLTLVLRSTLENLDKITESTRKLGPERADAFSWKKSAQVFLDVAERCS